MTDHRKPVGVKISPHATARFRERFPEVPEEQISGTIYREVQRALADGRRSSKLPKWVRKADSKSGRRNPERFVWNEQRTRCYPIMEDFDRSHERTGEFGRKWIVKTTLAAMSEEEAAEVRRLDKIGRENRGAANKAKRANRSALGLRW